MVAGASDPDGSLRLIANCDRSNGGIRREVTRLSASGPPATNSNIATTKCRQNRSSQGKKPIKPCRDPVNWRRGRCCLHRLRYHPRAYRRHDGDCDGPGGKGRQGNDLRKHPDEFATDVFRQHQRHERKDGRQSRRQQGGASEDAAVRQASRTQKLQIKYLRCQIEGSSRSAMRQRASAALRRASLSGA